MDDIDRAVFLLHERGEIRMQCAGCLADLSVEEHKASKCHHCGPINVDRDVRLYEVGLGGSA